MRFNQFISALKKNSTFKFLSSVQLAVPLMLVLLIISAVGTFYESQYNSQYAKLMIYNTQWFLFLLILLWINIFCATVSRIPYRKHHLGFVITHIGLMSLLGGAFVTYQSGIDGQLQVREKDSENRVILSDLELGYQFENSPSRQSIIIPKKVSKLEENQLQNINKEFGHLFTVEKYIPFARFDRAFQSDPNIDPKSIALSFNLKSKFFNVSEWLHTESTSSINMGPVTLKIKIESTETLNTLPSSKASKSIAKIKINSKPSKSKPADASPAKILQSFSSEQLIVKNSKTKETLKKLNLNDFKKTGLKINGAQISLKNQFRHAVVRDNKLSEGDGDRLNPALEITIEKDGVSTRDILYARFPEFSLRKENQIGLDFIYQTQPAEAPQHDTTEDLQPTHPPINESGATSAAMPDTQDQQGNTIEFYVNPKFPKQARIELYKNQQLVAQETLSPGQTLQTPWMGITLSIGAIIPQAKLDDLLTEVSPQKGQELPQSAVLIKLKNSDERIWFVEGETKQFNYNSRSLTIFYGPQIITLPFQIGLEQFSKIDYPGTNTPMSYESLVRVNDKSDAIKISMNEPLKQDSYTLYQSSYILNPGQTPVSVFSVNKDPGRPIKYAGSLILCLGIVIFTLMKSRYGKPKQK